MLQQRLSGIFRSQGEPLLNRGCASATTSRTNAPASIRCHQTRSTPKLLISGIPKQAYNKDIRNLCEETGLRVSRIIRPIDRFNLRGPHKCFLDLEDGQKVSEAVALLREKKLLGKTRKVESTTRNPREVFAPYTERLSSYYPDFAADYSLANLQQTINEGKMIFIGGFSRKLLAPDLKDKVVKLLGGESRIEAISQPKQTHLKGHWMSWRYGFFVVTKTSEIAASAVATLDGKVEESVGLVVRLMTVERTPSENVEIVENMEDMENMILYRLMRATGQKIDPDHPDTDLP